MLSFQKERYPYSHASAWGTSAALRLCWAHLFILQAHEDNLLHERQLGLFAPFRILANVARVECDLVAVLGALVGCFGGAVVVALRCWRTDPAALVLAVACNATAAASPARQTRARSHEVWLWNWWGCIVEIMGDAPRRTQG